MLYYLLLLLSSLFSLFASSFCVSCVSFSSGFISFSTDSSIFLFLCGIIFLVKIPSPSIIATNSIKPPTYGICPIAHNTTAIHTTIPSFCHLFSIFIFSVIASATAITKYADAINNNNTYNANSANATLTVTCKISKSKTNNGIAKSANSPKPIVCNGFLVNVSLASSANLGVSHIVNKYINE